MKILRTLSAVGLAVTCSLSLLTTTAHAEIPVAPQPNPPSTGSGMLGDADGDGKADLWLTIADGRYTGEEARKDNGKTVFATNVTWFGQGGEFKGGFVLKGSVTKEIAAADAMAPVSDMNGDKRADFLLRFGDSLFVYFNKGDGYLERGPQVGHGWTDYDSIVFAGTLNGDSTNYLLARHKTTGDLMAYRLTNTGQVYTARKAGYGWGGMRFILGPGQILGDKKTDLVAIDTKGDMWCYRGAGPGLVYLHGRCGTGWDGYLTAFIPGDVDGDGLWDLVGVKKVTNPNHMGEPIGDLNSLPLEDRAPMYFYKNLGNSWWGKNRHVGHDMFQFKLFA